MVGYRFAEIIHVLLTCRSRKSFRMRLWGMSGQQWDTHLRAVIGISVGLSSWEEEQEEAINRFPSAPTSTFGRKGGSVSHSGLVEALFLSISPSQMPLLLEYEKIWSFLVQSHAYAFSFALPLLKTEHNLNILLDGEESKHWAIPILHTDWRKDCLNRATKHNPNEE